MKHEFKIKFLGALGRVTGSCTLIKFDNKQYLVDCGMVQGDNDADIINNKPFKFNPKEIEAVFLTHAHLDHCGLIPRLYKEGFMGKVWCTTATAKLSKEIMLDAASIMIENETLKPIYTIEDVNFVQFKEIDKSDTFKWNQGIPITNDLFLTPIRGSHILGSTAYSIGFKEENNKNYNIFFSGDIGKNSDNYTEQTFLKGRQTPHPNTTYFVSESTYGGRKSSDLTFKERIKFYQNLIQKQIVENKGTILIPTFSMHRFQEILTEVIYAIETYNGNLIKDKLIKARDEINYCLEQLNISKFSLSESRQILKKIDTFFKENNKYSDYEHIIKKCFHISIPLKLLNFDETKLKKHNVNYEILEDELIIHNINKEIFKAIDKIKKKGELHRAEHFYFFNYELNKDLEIDIKNLSLIPIELNSTLAGKITEIYSNELFLENITTKGLKSKWLNDSWKERFVDKKFTIKTLKKTFDQMSDDFPSKQKEIYHNNCKITQNSKQDSKIIITSSGMCDYGPIKNILNTYAEDENCTIVMNGYTPQGSNGEHLKKLKEYSEDEKSLFSIKVSNWDKDKNRPITREIKLKDVKADVKIINGYGGHADKNSLLDFMFYKDPRTGKYNCTPYFFLNHGDSNMRQALSKSIIEHAKKLLLNPDKCNFQKVPKIFLPDEKSGCFNLVTEEWEEDEISATQNNKLYIEILSNQKQILAEIKEQREILNKILEHIGNKNQNIKEEPCSL